MFLKIFFFFIEISQTIAYLIDRRYCLLLFILVEQVQQCRNICDNIQYIRGIKILRLTTNIM